MKLVVYRLSRIRFSGDVCGGEATVNFYKSGGILVHSEKVKGKCISKYVRSLPDFEFDYEMVDCDEATSFVYEIQN